MKFTRIYCVAVFLILLFFTLSADNVNITVSGGQIFVGAQANFNVTGLDMSKATNMEWDFADGTSKQSGVSVSHSFKEPGNYNVKFTWLKNGNPRETTKNVNVGDNRNVSVQGSNFIPGMEIQFQTSNFVENQLKWDFGDGNIKNGGGKNEKHGYQNPGNYTVKVYDFNGNTSTAITCSVNVGPDNRSVAFSPGSPMIKQKITFTAQNFASSNLRWDFGNGVKNGGATMDNTYDNPGNYTVKVKDQQNPSLNEITVSVNVQPDPRTVALQTQPAKAKHNVSFQVNNFSSGNLRWDFGDNKNQNGGQTISHVYSQAGNYTLKVKDQSNQSLPEVTLNVNVQPDNRRLDTMPHNPGLYTEITFNTQNFMGGNLDWDFGDNTRTNGPASMKHRYTRMGRFIVKVKQAGSSNEPVEKDININRDMRRIEVNPRSLVVGQRATLRLLNSDVNQVGWQIGNQPPKQNSPPTLQHQFKDPGRFEIKCLIQNQSPLRMSVNVREHRQISVTPQYIFEGSKVIFNTRNFNTSRLKWNFGDGTVQQAGKQHTHEFRRPGNFTVKVFDFNGQARVPVEKRVRVLREDRSIQVKSQIVFKGSEIEIEAKNFRDNTVEWNFGDGGVRRGSRVIKYTFRSTGNFQVAAVDFAGKGSKKISRNLQVQMDTRKVTVPLEVIAGEAYDLTLQNVSGGNFEWHFSDGRRRSGISAKGKKFASPGTHQIKLIDRSGKYPPLLKKIVVKPDNRLLQVTPKFVLPNENMKAKAVNFRGNTVKWDFGDGTVVDGRKSMNHKYKAIGKYKVQAVDFGGKSQKPFTQNVSVVELTPDFDITTVELAFTDGKYYKVVPKKSMAPRYRLKLKVRGRGVIRGEWLLDGMSMGTFSVFALENQIITLQGNKVVKLPLQDLGIHNFTFSFGNYDFKKSLPTIRYFIALGGAINIRAPLAGAKIAAAEGVKLRWYLRKKSAKYELAISAIPFQFLHDSQIKWQDVGNQSEFLLDLKQYKPGTWLYWQVRQVDNSGRVLTTSEIASFKIAAAQ